MTNSYYYLLSSLPFLAFNIKPPIIYSHFMEQCSLWTSSRDLKELRISRLDIQDIALDHVRNDALRRWIIFENTIRNELVRFRAKNMGLDEYRYLRLEMEMDVDAISLVKKAINGTNPLDDEMNLLKVRWAFLEELEIGHDFDLTALIAYSLKLQILERINRFGKERGQEVLKRIYKKSLNGSQK